MSKHKTFPGREKLLGLLTQKLGLFEKIYELCEEQAGFIAKERFDELDGSAGKVQQLRDEINGLHQELDVLMQSYAMCPDEEKDAGIGGLIEKNREVIERCARLNAHNIEEIKALTDEHTKKIDEQSAKRKGITGYAQAMPNTPEMFDKNT